MHIGKLFSLGAALSLVSSALAAAPPYSAAQAKAGQTTYNANCAGCHGNKLQGGAGPALAGQTFLSKWASHKVDDLYYIIHTQMPLNAPGSLSTTQYLNTVTYILQANKFTPGKKALTQADLTKYTLKK